MPAFVIDEDMPRSTARILRTRGHRVLDVRDCGLKGESDEEVFRFAQREQAILLTEDLGFGNILRFPVGSHHGIVVVHFPNEMSNAQLNTHIVRAFDELAETDLEGNLIIVEPGKVRIRRK